MSRWIENRFEIDEDGSVHDRYSNQELTTISVPKSYMDVMYKPGFIHPLGYDEEEKKAIVVAYEETPKLEDSSEDAVLKEFLPLMSALETMHQMDLVYGNLEPTKLIHQADGYYLKDFGLGKEPKEKNDYSAYEYYAFQGRGCKASDVYSVCAILYEIFTGIHLPNAETRMNASDLEPLIAFGVSEETSNVITKGLSVFADDRFSNMTEFMLSLYGEKKLENFRNDWSITVRKMKNSEDLIQAKIARENVPTEKEEKPSLDEEEFVSVNPKKKLYLLLSGICVFVVLVLLFVLFFSQKEPQEEPTPTIQMTALPVASGGAIDYSATGSAVTGSAVSGEAVEVTKMPTSSPTMTPVVTKIPTATPTKKPKPKVTKKPKPKKTPKPTKKPVKRRAPKPTKQPVVTKAPVKKRPKATKKPKFQLKDDFSLE